MKPVSKAAALCGLAAMALMSGCHSYRIDATVENRTGKSIQLLEVDYPNASFGVDALSDGSDYHYRFQVQGRGPIKVQYTEGGTLTVHQVTGPGLSERQEGQLEIVLLPGGQTQFHPKLTPER